MEGRRPRSHLDGRVLSGNVDLTDKQSFAKLTLTEWACSIVSDNSECRILEPWTVGKCHHDISLSTRYPYFARQV